MIPMVDLKASHATMRAEIEAGVQEVLANCQFILGPNVQALEREVADYLGSRHALSCASGTDALHLALHAAGIGPGDEVITTPFTFIATAEAICYRGAIPVFVDIDPETFNIDPVKVSEAITERTRAIIPVHLFGQPADMTALEAIAEQHRLLLVEDCAQSFGARRDGRQTGTFGLAGCFSFFPSKNLGGYGDGGLIATDSDELLSQLVALRNHGSFERYHHHVVGYNSRLDELQAVVLRSKLRRIDEFNRERRRVAQGYNDALGELAGVATPYEDPACQHVYHQYTLLTDQREAIMAALQKAEIASAIYYPIPLHRQEVFCDRHDETSLPVAERIAQQCLSLPIYPELGDEQVARITAVIGEAVTAAQ